MKLSKKAGVALDTGIVFFSLVLGVLSYYYFRYWSGIGCTGWGICLDFSGLYGLFFGLIFVGLAILYVMLRLFVARKKVVITWATLVTIVVGIIVADFVTRNWWDLKAYVISIFAF